MTKPIKKTSENLAKDAKQKRNQSSADNEYSSSSCDEEERVPSRRIGGSKSNVSSPKDNEQNVPEDASRTRIKNRRRRMSRRRGRSSQGSNRRRSRTRSRSRKH